jgi:putative ABC transport system permease protein
LLEWLLPADDGEAVLGDLEEAFRVTVVPTRGLGAARRWYWMQACSIAVRLTRLPHRSAALEPRRPGGHMFRDIWLDVRYGVRTLRRSPGFTAIVVITLALGIGATSTIFSVVNPVLIEALPYPEPKRLVMVWEREPGGASSNTGYATFADIRRDSRTLASVAAMSYWTPTLQGDEPERLEGQSVTSDFFRTLGVRPFIGRDFTPAEDAPGRNAVTILSYGLWQRRFGGDPSVVGRQTQVSGRLYQVIGVLPREFESLLAPGAQLWRPLGYDLSHDSACRTCRHLRAVARLAARVPLEQAALELNTLSEIYARDYPTQYATPGITLVPLHDDLVQEVRPAMLVVFGAVSFVLLIACANVMNLLLGRAVTRQDEFAIRTALGARPARVARQVLTETMLLALAGAALGVGLAWFGVTAVVALGPADIPRLASVELDRPVLLASLALALTSGLVFGLAPALAVRHADLHAGLRPAGRASGGRSRRALRGGLVVAEVVLAFALLAGAGLLVRSLDRLLGVDVGFDPEQVLALDVQASGPAYAENEPVWAMQERLLEAVRAVPGVATVAHASQVPLGGNFDGSGVRREDRPLPNPEDAPSAQRYAVSPDYLAALRIPVLRGRGFTLADRTDAPPVVLINDAFARAHWPGEDPLGKRVQLGSFNSPQRTIVGIVGDVRHVSLDEPMGFQIYHPENQWPWANTGVTLVVRGAGRPEDLVRPIRQAVWSVDRTLAISGVAPMDALVRGTTAQRRFAMVAFELFALVALVLAAAGIYGVLAGSVAQRTREFGIRAALGATRSGILSLAMRQGLHLATLGLLIGWVGAFALARLLRGLLYEIAPGDPVTLGAVTVVLGGVALAASLGPAWRAARVDPVTSLKTD